MSELTKKSLQNITAAERLIADFGYFAASVHCSYYSCVQLMMDIMINDFDIPDREILQHARDANSGSHAFAINLITTDMSDSNLQLARNFNNKINDLRSRRETADYREQGITLAFAGDAYNIATDVKNWLSEFYEVPDEN